MRRHGILVLIVPIALAVALLSCTGPTTPAPMQMYKHTGTGISFEYPADWTISDELTTKGLITLRPSTGGAVIYVALLQFSGTIDDYAILLELDMNEYKSMREAGLLAPKILYPFRTTLSSRPAIKFGEEVPPGIPFNEAKNAVVIATVNPDITLKIQYEFDPIEFKKHIPVFEHIAETMNIPQQNTLPEGKNDI